MRGEDKYLERSSHLNLRRAIGFALAYESIYVQQIHQMIIFGKAKAHYG